MKTILGLDLGPNSIGGCIIQVGEKAAAESPNLYKDGKIVWAGSRIIPTDTNLLTNFEKGEKLNSTSGTSASKTAAATRRQFRMARRIKQRYVLRRTRMIRAMKVLGWLDQNFPENFENYFNDHKPEDYRISYWLPVSPQTRFAALKQLGIRPKNHPAKLAVSEDWIVWYLRSKALKERITKFELARIIYMMNQRRGFRSSRKDLIAEGESSQRQWVERTHILSVEEDTTATVRKDKKKCFIITAKGLETGRDYSWTKNKSDAPDWAGKEYDLLFTEKLQPNGQWTLKTPESPKAESWTLQMVSLDNQIEKSGKHPGEFFFEKLKTDKNYRIRQQVVKRFRYKAELEDIFRKQAEFWGDDASQDNPNLKSTGKLEELALELYPRQTKEKLAKYQEILANDLHHLFSEDIIYYQRPLRSQKSLILGCRYEKNTFKKPEWTEARQVGRKVSPVSAPAFQEFRIWQQIHNLRVIKKVDVKPATATTASRVKTNVDYTDEVITPREKEELFRLFDGAAQVSEYAILDILGLKTSEFAVTLFAVQKAIKGNTTKAIVRKIAEASNDENLRQCCANEDQFSVLWHILYSIQDYREPEGNEPINSLYRDGVRTALRTAAEKKQLPSFSKATENVLASVVEFEEGYAAFSQRCLNRLLPLMRAGSLWDPGKIDKQTQERINTIVDGGWSALLDWSLLDSFTQKALKKLKFESIENFQGLSTHEATYVVYGRHSEKSGSKKYERPEEIDVLRLIPNGSLRQPLVEKVIRETLLVVRDLWVEYGRPDEIHIELAREMKNNSDKRSAISKSNSKNRDRREEARVILRELLKDPHAFEGSKPNPNSPVDIKRFELWRAQCEPTAREVERYSLWLEQKCFSPYTGRPIPLSKLFSGDYDIDHILPRALIKYDSPDNLVVAETYVNMVVKKAMLPVQFIETEGGRIHEGHRILTLEEYQTLVQRIFWGKKRQNLLSDSVPEDFLSRQLNETRYITKKVAELLGPVAVERIVFSTGGITSELKNEWSLTEVWKELLKGRFERLERLDENSRYVIEATSEPKRSLILQVENDPEFELKRIDHRHHALDALIIAATTGEHIRYLNTLSAADSNEEIRDIKRWLVKGKVRKFNLPWESFCLDAKRALENAVVTSKQAKSPVTKPRNKFVKWVEIKGKWTKTVVEQRGPKPDSGKHWLAVSGSLFKQPQGNVTLRKTKMIKNILQAFEIHLNYTQTQGASVASTTPYVVKPDIRALMDARIAQVGPDIDALKKNLKKVPLTDQAGEKVKEIEVAVFEEFASKRTGLEGLTRKQLDRMPYAESSPLRKLLDSHVSEYGESEKLAFGPEALDEFRRKYGTRKVTLKEASSAMKIGGSFMEADSMAYFVIRVNKETGSRTDEGFKMMSLSLAEVLLKKLNNEPIVVPDERYSTILLKTDDLVYLPPNDVVFPSTNPLEAHRIYRVSKFTGSVCYFLPHTVATPVVKYDSDRSFGEFASQNSLEKAVVFRKDDHEEEARQVKMHCLKLKVNRIGKLEFDLSK